MGSQRNFSSTWVARECKCWRTCSMPSLRPVACPPHGVRALQCTSPEVVTGGTALTTGHLHLSRLSTSCSPSSFRTGFHMWYACTTSNMRSGLAGHNGGRGTLNPLHNLLAVVRQLTQAKKASYACFFDAARAYDSVTHALLFHRLLRCGVTDPAVAALTAMYSSASSMVRVGSALSPAFAVQRCAAQGCLLFPLLYAIFVDPVLQDMQALSHPDLLWVGPAATQQKLVGQALPHLVPRNSGGVTAVCPPQT